jgi:A/G-specific adenine glycosylase
MLARLLETSPLLSPDELDKLRQALLQWFSTQQRDLPWRRTRDAYAVWISEIMLQQTRVAAVIPYYERFIARFPDFEALAQAPESELLAHWAGLGYYYRARNLQKAAQIVDRAGSFPKTHSAIRQLPGVGDYTAAAISSISFDLPHAVLDGNVFRVLSRLFADPTNIASLQGRRHFGALAQELLDNSHPGAFNQAVMELGATVCLPKNPQCLVCPIADWCRARKTGTQSGFPIKIVPQKSLQETRNLFWIERDGQVLAWQRPANSRLMPGFFELPELEHLPDTIPSTKLGSFRHGITFHNYRFDLWAAALPPSSRLCDWVSLSEIDRLPVSTVFKKAARVASKVQRLGATAQRVAASSG